MNEPVDMLSLLVALGGDENGVLCLRTTQEFKVHWRCLQKTESLWWKGNLNDGSIIIAPPFVRSDLTRCDVCWGDL